MFWWLVLAYFVSAASMLRLFTSWSMGQVLGRAAACALICNLPLLWGGWMGFAVYAILAWAAVKILLQVFDAPPLAALSAVASGAMTALGVMLAFR